MEWILIFIFSSGLAAICSYPSASAVFRLSIQLNDANHCTRNFTKWGVMRSRANLREAGTLYFQVEMLVMLLPGSPQSLCPVGEVSFKTRLVDTALVSKKSLTASPLVCLLGVTLLL